MILADSSAWIDHLRKPNPLMMERLARWQILIHPLVIGELAAGSLADRQRRLRQLTGLPKVQRASDYITLQLIEAHRLYSRGLSYIDLQLLASTRITPNARLWTFDKGLAAAASELDVSLMS